jgi:hypothetical protein
VSQPTTLNEPALSGSAKARIFPSLLVAAVFLAMALRLLWMITRNEVNLLYYDEWDLYRKFIPHPGSSWLELFLYQPGPHRQGIGYILMEWIAAASHWNTRAMSFAVVAFTIASALLALVLKKCLFGEITCSDVIIPLLFLAPVQYEIFLGAANLPTTSLPLFQVILYALAWTVESAGWRYCWVLILNFLLIYCGYGFFAGILTPLLLALELTRALRLRRDASQSVIAMLIALASLASFFVGYRFLPAAECFRFPYHPFVNHFWFVALMFANLLRLKGTGLAPTIMGLGLLLLAVWIFVGKLRDAWRMEPKRNDDHVMLALTGFSLLYAANAAVGRVCFGVEYGQSSRYAPYLFPVFLAFYFALLELRPQPRRTFTLTIYVIALAVAAVFLSPRDRRTIAYYHDGKAGWKACYLQRQDPVACTRETGFAIYPNPSSIQIRRELDYMQQDHLNLFR